MLQSSGAQLSMLQNEVDQLEPQLKTIGVDLPELSEVRSTLAVAHAKLAEQKGDAEKDLKERTTSLRAKESALKKRLAEAAKQLKKSKGLPAGESRVAALQGLSSEVAEAVATSEELSAEASTLGIEPGVSPEGAKSLASEVTTELDKATAELRVITEEREATVSKLTSDLNGVAETLQSLALLQSEQQPARLEEQEQLLQKATDQLKPVQASIDQAAPHLSEPIMSDFRSRHHQLTQETNERRQAYKLQTLLAKIAQLRASFDSEVANEQRTTESVSNPLELLASLKV